jgi:hypothetical protein
MAAITAQGSQSSLTSVHAIGVETDSKDILGRRLDLPSQLHMLLDWPPVSICAGNALGTLLAKSLICFQRLGCVSNQIPRNLSHLQGLLALSGLIRYELYRIIAFGDQMRSCNQQEIITVTGLQPQTPG